jgi:quercetin dioxygenase-like cupin family protein
MSTKEGEAFWLFGALATIKISADDTAGQYCLIDVEVPPGVGSSWHVHRDEDEWFYVRDGEFTLFVGDARMTLTAGGFAFGPMGVPHTFFGGPDGGKILCGAGAKFEGLLREIAEPATEHVLPPPPEGPPDMELLMPIAAKWAYDILGPPGVPPGH